MNINCFYDEILLLCHYPSLFLSHLYPSLSFFPDARDSESRR